MKAELVAFKIDLVGNKVELNFRLDGAGHIGISAPLKTPGDQTESQMKEGGIRVGKAALQAALTALEG